MGEERGQTFKSYIRQSFKCTPHGGCNTMYIVPIGDFDPARSPPVDDLVAYAKAFFGCNVKVHAKIHLDAVLENSRVGDEGQLQLDAEVLRSFLCRGMKAPRDSFCLLAITMADLYVIKDGEAWNFVFGQGSAMDGVGVFSFARYDPSGMFVPPDGSSGGLPEMTGDEHARLLHRCCRVLTHEAGHIVGIKHCIHFRCLMNGSNHLEESDGYPLHMCPVCLRELAAGCGFNVLLRYRMLWEWYAAHEGFEGQRDWVQQRIHSIEHALAMDEHGGEHACEPPVPQCSAQCVATDCETQTGKSHRERPGSASMAAHCREHSKVCRMFRCQGKRGCLCPGA